MTLRPKATGSFSPTSLNQSNLRVTLNSATGRAILNLQPHAAGKHWHPRNNDFAGKIYPLRSPQLREKYATQGGGVPFTRDGYPNFSKFIHKSIKPVKIVMTGNHRQDFNRANAIVGLKHTPKGWTWHHHQDCQTMQLIPGDLHRHVGHSGAVSKIRHIKNFNQGR